MCSCVCEIETTLLSCWIDGLGSLPPQGGWDVVYVFYRESGSKRVNVPAIYVHMYVPMVYIIFNNIFRVSTNYRELFDFLLPII